MDKRLNTTYQQSNSCKYEEKYGPKMYEYKKCVYTYYLSLGSIVSNVEHVINLCCSLSDNSKFVTKMLGIINVHHKMYNNINEVF